MYYSVLCFAMCGGSAWRLIYISVQYNGGLLPDIILLTQDYYHRGTRLNTMQWLEVAGTMVEDVGPVGFFLVLDCVC